MPKNKLDKVELQSATDYDRERRKSRKVKKRIDQVRRSTPKDGTRIAYDVRKRQGSRNGRARLPPPPLPKNRSLAEIEEMDPDDPVFKHPQGAPRKRNDIPDEDLHWRDLIRKKKQERAQGRRARVRHYEAKVVKAREVLEEAGKGQTKDLRRKGVFVEDIAIAEGILDLSDWDTSELARGYRRNRDGRFGPPPKYIPREIQQECFRRLVGRGDHMMRQEYIRSIKELIKLVRHAQSEKVKLDAIKELSDRTRGKIPDTLRVEMDAPWQDMLVDSVVPIDEVEPLEVSGTKRALDLGPDDAGVDDAPSGGAHRTAATDGNYPSPRGVERSAPALPAPRKKKAKKKVPTSTLEDLAKRPKARKKVKK